MASGLITLRKRYLPTTSLNAARKLRISSGPHCLRLFARDPQSEDEAGADQDSNDHKEPTSTGPTRLGG